MVLFQNTFNFCLLVTKYMFGYTVRLTKLQQWLTVILNMHLVLVLPFLAGTNNSYITVFY